MPCSRRRYSISVPTWMSVGRGGTIAKRSHGGVIASRLPASAEERKHLGGRAREALLAPQDVMAEHPRGTALAAQGMSMRSESSTGAATRSSAASRRLRRRDGEDRERLGLHAQLDHAQRACRRNERTRSGREERAGARNRSRQNGSLWAGRVKRTSGVEAHALGRRRRSPAPRARPGGRDAAANHACEVGWCGHARGLRGLARRGRRPRRSAGRRASATRPAGSGPAAVDPGRGEHVGMRPSSCASQLSSRDDERQRRGRSCACGSARRGRACRRTAGGPPAPAA